MVLEPLRHSPNPWPDALCHGDLTCLFCAGEAKRAGSWTSQDIRVFFDALALGGRDWDKIGKRLTLKSKDQVRGRRNGPVAVMCVQLPLLYTLTGTFFFIPLPDRYATTTIAC